MKYGYFDDQKKEYVITNPRTPTKWINYVGTLAFGGFVDHTGGALICKGDPALNRISKYIPQLPSSQFKGTTLYLRIKQKEGYRVFSPYFVPTLDEPDRYECHVGLGYTRFVSEFYGVKTEVTVFVPLDENRLVRDIRVTNLSGGPLEIDAIPVVEYTHPDALKQFTNADWVPQTMQSRAHRDDGGLTVLAQYAFMRRDSAVNFFASNRAASSFESDRVTFLGDHEYGTWAGPLSLQEPELGNHEANRGENIAALLHRLGVVHPGDTRRLITQLGQETSIEKALPRIEEFRDQERVVEALGNLARFWEGYLSALQVDSPSPDMNRMLNIHNPRQCYVTNQWSRYLSLYQLGLGSRGIGFRDSTQDVLSITPFVPEEGRILIEKALQVQRRDGSAMHQYNPLTMEANEGDSREMEDRPDYYGDDHLWAILAIGAYLKETDNLGFLDASIPYYEKDEREQPLESETVREHMERALAFTRHNLGAHGLPLLGYADWNDSGNLPTGAESMFVANLYGRALLEMLDLAQHLGDTGAAKRYATDYEAMKDRFNQRAWDGGWYIRYIDADGTPLGSKTNRVGQVYANAQSWPVLSGFAAPERARMALNAVYGRLNTRNGIKLSAPGYDGYDPSKGGVSTYPPGAKENGGIFLHANPWVIIAETMVGNGKRAYEYYSQMNPAAKNEKIEEFECEPYVYPQNILGDEHPRFGMARNSWLTGTASWAYLAATQYILGVRPTYSGLCIDPCIPEQWNGFRVTRVFRGITHQIEVLNPEHVSKGIKSISVNGQEMSGRILPVLARDRAHRVEVVMGQTMSSRG